MQLDVNDAMDFLTQAVILIGGLIGVVGAGMYALKRWIRNTVATPTERLLEQVEPNGGRKESTRHLIEELVDKTDQIIDRVEEIETQREEDAHTVQRALSQAQSALTIATHTGERLDKMLERQERHDG